MGKKFHLLNIVIFEHIKTANTYMNRKLYIAKNNIVK